MWSDPKTLKPRGSILRFTVAPRTFRRKSRVGHIPPEAPAGDGRVDASSALHLHTIMHT